MPHFGTAGIRGAVAETVTPEFGLAVGRAVGLDAWDQDIDTIVLGRDGRVTGATLAAAVTAGAASAGIDVRRAGRVPTPALAFASRDRIGVMLTASHNPPPDNGIKVFADGVEFDGTDERRIEGRLADEPGPVDWNEWGRTTAIAPIDEYRRGVEEFIQSHGLSLAGLQIVLDCGNGMAALAAPQVLTSLGADVTTLNANVDGRFPARASKPTPESLADLRAFVADGPADVGFGFDGDADRIVVVDAAGDVVHEDTVLAILAEHYTRSAERSDPVVVTTPNASSRIDERVREAGGSTTRVALGYLVEGVTEARSAGREVAFAAEPWKHIHPLFGGWIDAVASAAVFGGLVADADGVDSLRAAITERPYLKDEVACPDSRKADVMTRLESALPDRFPEAEPTRDHGVRLEFPDGSWILVRPSGTEPYLRLYVESEEAADLLAAARAAVEDVL